MDDKTLLGLIQSLSLEEKAALCSGLDAWQTKPNPAKGIPSLRMADGPHGVRVEDFENEKANGGPSKPATCFPPQVTLACAFSPELTGRVGAAIAEECLHYGVGMVLGPGVNIKRHPLCGRNFEYYSEDPLLAGELAAGFIRGVQGKGVATSLKHFAVNNQEKLRMSISAQVDERALFDIYLRAFEIAVQKAQPATVMASYNRVNGGYATENRRLLWEILRLRFGFTGAVVSDWGAVNRRAEGIAAGCDLEMPGCAGVNDEVIVKAVQSGALSEDALDTACWNLLKLIFKYTRQDKPAPECDFGAHHALAGEALCKSTVLLKNDGLLPLAGEAGVAIIGEMAEKPRFQGGGSSVINPTRTVSLTQAMRAQGLPFTYAPGYMGDETTPQLLRQAEEAAKNAQTAVLVLGLPDAYECEGYDREHLRLPECQLRLLAAVAAANPNLCVVLCCGAPVELPWLDNVKALLCPHLGGQAMGDALVKLLYGRENPGGKLAESWPLALKDAPAYHHFPMGPNQVRYNESVFVGYRYYDTAQKQVAFPFGHGLSYTQYEYGPITLSAQSLEEDQELKVSFELANTGGCGGEEIVQLYAARKGSARFQPAKQLVAFARVAVPAGQRVQLCLVVPHAAFAFYDTASGGAVVEAGEVELLLGASSRDIRSRAALQLQGATLPPAPEVFTPGGPYGQLADNTFGDAAFAQLVGALPNDNTPPQKGQYTLTTPLGLLSQSLTGRLLLRLARMVAKKTIRFSQDPVANRKAAMETAFDLPLKNLPLTTGGRFSHAAADALLHMCNGKGGFFRLVKALVTHKQPKAKA